MREYLCAQQVFRKVGHRQIGEVPDKEDNLEKQYPNGNDVVSAHEKTRNVSERLYLAGCIPRNGARHDHSHFRIFSYENKILVTMALRSNARQTGNRNTHLQ